jgi:membrane protease YdiL (CAAX protease family)
VKIQPVAGIALGAALFSAAAGRLPRPRRPTERDSALLIAAACSAGVEELLWRGAVPRLLHRTDRRFVVAITSLGFVLAHRRHARGRALATLALLTITLGSVAARRNGLATAVVAHATYDVLVLLDSVST